MQIKTNKVLLVGAFLGMTAVAFGAYCEHQLRPHISVEQYHSVSIALQYQLLHAVVISMLGLVFITNPNITGIRRLKTATWLFILGITTFSFSIYVAAVTGVDEFKRITPTGGTLLIAAWAMLAAASINKTIKRE